MPQTPSPSPDNYAIFKGNVYFTPSGGGRRHMGNVNGFSLTPVVETLEHFSSMSGIRTKDKEVVTTKGYTLEFTCEEITPTNLLYFALGSMEEDTEGNNVIVADDTSSVTGVLEFLGNNDIGPKLNFNFPNVTVRPNGGLELIGEDWANLPLTGEVLISGTEFFRATVVDSAGTE